MHYRNSTAYYYMEMTDWLRTTLKDSNQENRLGITCDAKINIKSYLSTTVNKTCFVIGVIKHSFEYIDTTILFSSYNSSKACIFTQKCNLMSALKKEVIIENIQHVYTKNIYIYHSPCHSTLNDIKDAFLSASFNVIHEPNGHECEMLRAIMV